MKKEWGSIQSVAPGLELTVASTVNQWKEKCEN